MRRAYYCFDSRRYQGNFHNNLLSSFFLSLIGTPSPQNFYCFVERQRIVRRLAHRPFITIYSSPLMNRLIDALFSTTGSWKIPNIDPTASKLIPVPTPFGGLIIISEQSITYANAQTLKSISMNATNILSYL